MMHHKAIRTLGSLSMTMIGGAFAVACAGGDTPARDRALEEAIAQAYANGGAVAGSGSVPTGGSGGRAPVGGAGGGGNQGGSSAVSGAGGGAAGSMTGEGGEAGSGGGAECDGFDILQMECSGPICHSGEGSLSAFAQDLATAESLVGVESPMCGGAGDVFDPANPAASLVIQKINGTSTCGTRMPIGTEPLTEEQVACLEEWIGTL